MILFQFLSLNIPWQQSLVRTGKFIKRFLVDTIQKQNEGEHKY